MIEEAAHNSLIGDPPVVAAPEALADRRELALVAFERTQMPMVVTDPKQHDNPIVLANQAFIDMTGYEASEVIGRNCRFLQGPLTAQAELDRLREALKERQHALVELLNYRKDGSTFWNQLSLSAVEGEGGELLYFFGSQKDVTARRRAEDLEAAERFLLMEVDHRAINALALVQSIVRLSQADDAGIYAASVQRRVDALVAAHRLLAKHRWAGAPFARLIASITSAQSLPRVHANDDEVMLSALIVQPMALVLHELMANAEGHGALARPHGMVTVNWQSASDEFLIQWTETGSASPASTPEAGFGLGIIQGVIERQLGGTAKFFWTNDGLQAELVVPHKEAPAFPELAP